jgi:hypothetical protein
MSCTSTPGTGTLPASVTLPRTDCGYADTSGIKSPTNAELIARATVTRAPGIIVSVAAGKKHAHTL